MTAETDVVSFVLRFVCVEPLDETRAPAQNWHGVIRHVQTNEEFHFAQWQDAVAFINRYVSLNDSEPAS